MKIIRNGVICLLAFAGVSVGSAQTPDSAQQTGATMTSPQEKPKPIAAWTTEQIVTSSVHEAWVLSGRDEGRFFEIVETLAGISARKRGITLPDDKEAGRKMGAYIKAHAKGDRDQLLYSLVDQAVRMIGTNSSESATSKSANLTR
jgi:hypothetical protein